jgi:uncharacterized protein (TIGR03435 family)
MECLTWSYGVRPWQISGPDWFTADRYNIVGKAASPVDDDQLKLMLQRLLEERFGMALRREKKESSVIALLPDKSGPKLQPSAASTEAKQDTKFVASNGDVRFTFRNTPLERLSGILSNYGWGPVVDMTGLAGGFDFTYERPHLDDGDDSSSSFGAVQGALQKQLGLRLERRKAPIDFLIVERVSRIPSEN